MFEIGDIVYVKILSASFEEFNRLHKTSKAKVLDKHFGGFPMPKWKCQLQYIDYHDEFMNDHGIVLWVDEYLVNIDD